jgi:hypothetical protein
MFPHKRQQRWRYGMPQSSDLNYLLRRRYPHLELARKVCSRFGSGRRGSYRLVGSRAAEEIAINASQARILELDAQRSFNNSQGKLANHYQRRQRTRPWSSIHNCTIYCADCAVVQPTVGWRVCQASAIRFDRISLGHAWTGRPTTG